MTQEHFNLMRNENKIYCIDVTLRNPGESWQDFIERAKQDDLGEWRNELEQTKKYF